MWQHIGTTCPTSDTHYLLGELKAVFCILLVYSCMLLYILAHSCILLHALVHALVKATLLYLKATCMHILTKPHTPSVLYTLS